MATQEQLNELVGQLKTYFDAVGPTDAAASRNDEIADFATFFLRNVPYGIVDPNYLRQGRIEYYDAYDDDCADDHLYWYFRHKPIDVGKALRISYTYTPHDGYSATPTEYSASLFIGYEHTAAFADWGARQPQRQALVQPQAQIRDPELVQALIRTLKESGRRQSSAGRSITRTIPNSDYNWLLDTQLPGNDQRWWTIKPGQPIQLDGLFWNNTPENPTTLNWPDIVGSIDLYDRLVHWEFGGRSYRITKAIRVPYTCELYEGDVEPEDDRPAGLDYEGEGWKSNLLIGFQGGGVHPGP